MGNPQNTNLSAFMFLLGIFLGMLLLNYLMNYAQRYIVAVISEEIAADMRQKVEDKHIKWKEIWYGPGKIFMRL